MNVYQSYPKSYQSYPEYAIKVTPVICRIVFFSFYAHFPFYDTSLILPPYLVQLKNRMQNGQRSKVNSHRPLSSSQNLVKIINDTGVTLIVRGNFDRIRGNFDRHSIWPFAICQFIYWPCALNFMPPRLFTLISNKIYL